jgi:hypothetical protein
MRLEDYCASGPGGNGLHYTPGLMTMDEELMALELGERVANEAIGLAVEGWGAFMDALYSEYEAEALGSGGQLCEF